MSDNYYTWSQFKQMVMDRLSVDADRPGADTYRDAIIRDGVINLQQLFDGYRNGHETLYLPADFVTEGNASRATKPPQSAIRDAYLCAIISTDSDGNALDNPFAVRYPLTPVSWNSRFALVNGYGCANDGCGRIAIDPHGYTFYVYPEVFDCWLVSIFWDGLKLDFKEDEETPFDEPLAGAVALYTKSMLAREVDHDVAMYDSYRRSFNLGKTALYSVLKEQREVKSVGIGGRPYGWMQAACLRDPCLACPPVVQVLQQVYSGEGDPNGRFPPSPAQYTALPLFFIDTLNQVTWSKSDSIKSNIGWT